MKLEVIHTEKAPAAVGPYSQGIGVDQFVFTSAQLPIVPGTQELVSDDIQKATRQTLDNLKVILEEGGATLETVVKVTIFVKNMDDFDLINQVYAEYFKNHKPARCLVEVVRLAKDALIEIEAIAIKK